MVKTNVKRFLFCNELVHRRLFSILSSNIKNDLLLLLFTSSTTSNFDGGARCVVVRVLASNL